MKMRRLDTMGTIVAVGIGAAVLVACTRDPVDSDDTETDTSTTNATTAPSVAEDTASTPIDPDSSDSTSAGSSSSSTGEPLDCMARGTCPLVDVVFIVDNSGSMGQKQLNLVRSFDTLIEELTGLADPEGRPLSPDVNIMVTTTDMGHPLCTPFQPPDYTPRFGAPVYEGCNARINRFTGLGTPPVVVEEVCTENCPVDVVPGAHFINFHPGGSNVPDDDPAAALACIGPQGIDGCGFEAPLEAMLQAINEGACWNDPEQESCDDDPEWTDTTEGFLRDGAMLAIVLVTDELDCSVLPPGGYSYFTDVNNDVYWNINPETMAPQATSAICLNAGITCTDDNGDGIYEEGCQSQRNDVLHPTARYDSYLAYLAQSREVVMLSLTGVSEVVAHNPQPPYEPIAGGAADLLYRNWIDAPFPAGDILQSEWDAGRRAAHKIFEFGDLAPGCFGHDDQGETISQAIPPVRIREVCEGLDGVDDQGNDVVRCCIESVCDDDFEPAFHCLGGMLSQAYERAN